VDRGIGYWVRVQTDEDVVVEKSPKNLESISSLLVHDTNACKSCLLLRRNAEDP